jgi:acetyl-CoA carboxylase carboxyl transferase subunit alpha
VISPEGCASILWRSATHAADAAAALRLTAKDLLQLGIIDRIIPEPLGGAHRKPEETVARVGEAIAASLRELSGKDRKTLLAERRDKFLNMGK